MVTNTFLLPMEKACETIVQFCEFLHLECEVTLSTYDQMSQDAC